VGFWALQSVSLLILNDLLRPTCRMKPKSAEL
jgi:hypothetical protein